MAYIGWLIAVLVLGTLVYPFLQLIPSKQQQRQIAFRQAAIQKGIHIQIRHPELPAEIANEYSALVHCAAYFKPAKTTLSNTYIALRSNTDNEWFWLNDRRPPAAIMAKMLILYKELPAFCLSVEQTPDGSTVFLRDGLPLDQITNVEDALNKLNALISQ
jgi:hypothetical protein